MRGDDMHGVTADSSRDGRPARARVEDAGAPGALAQLLACDEVCVLLLDADLAVRRVSGAARRLLEAAGLPIPADLAGLATCLDCPGLFEDVRRVLSVGDSVTRKLFLPKKQMHLVLRLYSAGRQADGIDGMVLSLVDATERQRSHSLERHLAAIVAYSDDAILSKDLNGIIASWNAGAQRLFGYTADETVGHSVTMLIPDGMPDEEPGILQRIRRGEAIDHYQTVRRRKDGTLIDVSLCVSPMFDDEGHVVGASKIARDITATRQAERQREVLINELNHRVKNTLATVQSLAFHSLRHASSMEAFAESFNARLLALSKTQNLLTRGDWKHASLRELVLSELAPWQKSGDAVHVKGEDMDLPPQLITSLGMLVHELTTNAAKYGALSVPGGQVHVRWHAADEEDARRLHFSWVESGGPPITRAPVRRGMGSRLLETLARSFAGQAELRFEPAGACCQISLQLDVPESPR